LGADHSRLVLLGPGAPSRTDAFGGRTES
jgi:hypothetical protein